MSRLRTKKNKNKKIKIKTMKQPRQRNTPIKVVDNIPHQYYTKMNYDGNVLSVESKQDNQRVKREKYTLNRLRREIPVAARLIEQYLGGEIPKELHNHEHLPNTVSIYPVLPNPLDLGLIPPATESPSQRSDRGTRQGRITMRCKNNNMDDDDPMMMKLYVSEIDVDNNDDLSRRHISRRHHRSLGRNIGNLPFT